MSGKYHDFDAQFAEMFGEKMAFKLFGKVYEIPKQLPAALVLELARREEDETLDNAFVFRAAGRIFGAEVLEELCGHPEFSAEMLADMVRWAFAGTGGDDSGAMEITEDDEGIVHRKN